uniref:Uncharacterized protein n=3 Tax=Hemiselmis andersenii TaxID=464988 RepID=A0A6U2DTK8_HEMAN
MAIAFVGYFIFLSLYVAVVVLQREAWNSETTYAAVKSYLTGQFRDPKTYDYKDFMNVASVEEWWNWMEVFFIDNAYVGQQTNFEDYKPLDMNTMLRYNRLTSGVVLVQRRGKEEQCNVGDEKYLQFMPKCQQRTYAEGLINPSKESFKGSDGVTEYKYEEREVGLPGSGNFDVGFFQNLDYDGDTAADQMAELRKQRWINEGTQWARAGFVVYNPNIGTFCAVQFKTDFDLAGTIQMKMEIEILLATNYTTWTDNIRMVLEIIFVILWFFNVASVIVTAVKEARIQQNSFAYFTSSGFNMLFALQLFLMLVATAVWANIVVDPSRTNITVTPEAILDKAGNPPNFSSVILLYQGYFIISGIIVLLGTFRILGFLRVNQNLSMLTDTLALMVAEFLQFAVVLIILTAAFMLMTHIYFGSTTNKFATPEAAFINTFEYLNGQADFFSLNEMDVVGAPIFYYTFIFIMIFVVLNITIAIIMDGYTLMQERKEKMASGYLKEVADLSAITQAKHGMLRMLAPCKGMMPAKWRVIKCLNGAILDRFAAPTKDEVLELLEPIMDPQHHVVSFETVKRKLRDMQTTPERLESIFDRFDAWEEPAYDLKVSADTRLDDAMKKVKQQIYSVLADQKRVESKIDMLLSHFAK